MMKAGKTINTTIRISSRQLMVTTPLWNALTMGACLKKVAVATSYHMSVFCVKYWRGT
jgi:hypothetical protein